METTIAETIGRDVKYRVHVDEVFEIVKQIQSIVLPELFTVVFIAAICVVYGV